jgi:DNA-binding protein H-NS
MSSNFFALLDKKIAETKKITEEAIKQKEAEIEAAKQEVRDALSFEEREHQKRVKTYQEYLNRERPTERESLVHGTRSSFSSHKDRDNDY